LDAIIELPLPDAEQRLIFTAKRSLDLLSPFFSGEAKSILLSYLPPVYRSHGEILPTPKNIEAQEVTLREHLDSIALAGSRPNNTSAFCTDVPQFNVANCIYSLVAGSQKWSLKEIAKFLISVRSEVLGTER
jgi:hypothetical protein